MTAVQREVFSLLYGHGPKYVRQIARILSRAEGVVNEAVQGLERRGLVVSTKHRSRRVCMVAGRCWL